MKPSRHQIAAAVTVVALGGLAAAALASGGAEVSKPSPEPTASTFPEVRTEVVRETVHRRARAGGPGPSPSAGPPATTGPGPSPSSGRGRERGEDEHEVEVEHELEDHGDDGGGHGRGRGRGGHD